MGNWRGLQRTALILGLSTVAVGASATLAGPAPAAPAVTEHGFVAGPSCDARATVAKVIGETSTERYVICQDRGVWPPKLHFIGENKFKPVPHRFDNVGFGPQTYVVNAYGNKILITANNYEVHRPDGSVISSSPAQNHTFEF